MEISHLLFSFYSEVARVDLLDLPIPLFHTNNFESHTGEIIYYIVKLLNCFLQYNATYTSYTTYSYSTLYFMQKNHKSHPGEIILLYCFCNTTLATYNSLGDFKKYEKSYCF